ncbi:hypothetical protein U1Q18_027824, partial [Sarracenia purpurea var. burkii]
LIQGSYGAHTTLETMNGKLCSALATGRSISMSMLSNVYSKTMQMHINARTWEEETCFNLENSLFPGNVYELGIVLFAGCDMVLVQVGRTIVHYDMMTKKSKVVCSTAKCDMRYVAYVNSIVYI